jgi:hypothetical protein
MNPLNTMILHNLKRTGELQKRILDMNLGYSRPIIDGSKVEIYTIATHGLVHQ